MMGAFIRGRYRFFLLTFLLLAENCVIADPVGSPQFCIQSWSLTDVGERADISGQTLATDFAEAKRALDAKGVKYRPLHSDAEGDYIEILPQRGESPLNTMAAVVKEKYGVSKVIFLPSLKRSGRGGFFRRSTRELAVGPVEITEGRPTQIASHEIEHAMFDSMRRDGIDSVFHSTVVLKEGFIDQGLKPYNPGFSVEELSAKTASLSAKYIERDRLSAADKKEFYGNLYLYGSAGASLNRRTLEVTAEAFRAVKKTPEEVTFRITQYDVDGTGKPGSGKFAEAIIKTKSGALLVGMTTKKEIEAVEKLSAGDNAGREELTASMLKRINELYAVAGRMEESYDQVERLAGRLKHGLVAEEKAAPELGKAINELRKIALENRRRK